MRRFGAGSLVPNALGIQDYGAGAYGAAGQPPQQSPAMGEQDELAALLSLNKQRGAVAPQAAGKKKMDWSQFAQSAGLGAMAGLGGKSGVAMAPILALLMSLGKGKMGAAPTTAKTPKFNAMDDWS